MYLRHQLFRGLLVASCLLGGASCGHRQGNPPPTTATAPPVMPVNATTQTFHAQGIQFDYPADWKNEKAMTAVFAVAAPPGANISYASISLDIPRLPWHLPGMITVGMVSSGYVDDLRKNTLHDAVVKEQCQVNVPDASARRVTCCGHENGKPSTDVAVIIVHADKVYILSADSDDHGGEAARKALDTAVASLKWTN